MTELELDERKGERHDTGSQRSGSRKVEQRVSDAKSRHDVAVKGEVIHVHDDMEDDAAIIARRAMMSMSMNN